MTDPVVTNEAPAADDFAMHVTIGFTRNGKPWTSASTESFSMDQTNAVIAQHVVISAVKDMLFKMGAASAAAKDPEFAAKYAAIKALLA